MCLRMHMKLNKLETVTKGLTVVILIHISIMFTWYIKSIPLYICVGDSERGKKILFHYSPKYISPLKIKLSKFNQLQGVFLFE